MTATPPGPPGFLTARVSDWEREAPDIHRSDCESVQYDYGGVALGPCECGVPAQVLAECAAIRAIVEEWQALVAGEADMDYEQRGNAAALWGYADGLRRAAKRLAAVHADHPDYRRAWRV